MEFKEVPDKKNMPRSHSGGIIIATRRERMKDIAPSKFASIQAVDTFQLWNRALKEYVYWHDPVCKQLTDACESNWTMENPLMAGQL